MLSGGFWGAVTSFSLHAATAQSKPQNESSGPAREPLMLSMRRHAAARHVSVLYVFFAFRRLLFTAFRCCGCACAWWCRMLAVACRSHEVERKPLSDERTRGRSFSMPIRNFVMYEAAAAPQQVWSMAQCLRCDQDTIRSSFSAHTALFRSVHIASGR